MGLYIHVLLKSTKVRMNPLSKIWQHLISVVSIVMSTARHVTRVHTCLLPRRGLEEVTGMVSATMFRNTVRDSKIVTP